MKQAISPTVSVIFLKTVLILATAALPVSLVRAEAVTLVVYGDTNESFCSISGALGEEAQYFQNHRIDRADYDTYCRSQNFFTRLGPICSVHSKSLAKEDEWKENLQEQTCHDHFYMYVGSSLLCNRWNLKVGSEERFECDYFLHTTTVGMKFVEKMGLETLNQYADEDAVRDEEYRNAVGSILDETYEKWIEEEKQWVSTSKAIIEERDQYYGLAVQLKNQNEKLIEEANSIISQYRRELNNSRDTINELANRLADTQSRRLVEERQRKALALMSLGLTIAGGGRYPSSFSKPSTSMHYSTGASNYSTTLMELGARIYSGQPMFGSPSWSSGPTTPTRSKAPGGFTTCIYNVAGGEASQTISGSICPVSMKFGYQTGFLKRSE